MVVVMLLYLLFPTIAIILDIFAYRMKGTVVSFILAAVAIGILIIGLPILVAPSTYLYGPQKITTPTGNITVQPTNATYTNTKVTESFSLFLGEIFVLIQVAYAMLIFAFMFTDYRKSKYN